MELQEEGRYGPEQEIQGDEGESADDVKVQPEFSWKLEPSDQLSI